jgi:Spy/CpxP family protein refolding chaperone
MRLILTLLALLIAAPAAAQPEDGPPPDREASQEDRDKMMDRVRMMRMYALTEALELDEATAAKLFPYLRQGDQAIERLHEEKRTFKKQLRDMAQSETYDDQVITKLIRGISELDIAIAKERSTQLQGLSKVLSSEQRVKFLLVRSRFEGEVREMMREERRRTRGERRRRRGGEPPPE